MTESGRDNSIPERLRRQRASLADFGLRAFQTDDLDELLLDAAKLVSEALDIRLVKILELQPGGRRLLIRAGVGWKPGVVGQVTIGADMGSPAGYALRTTEPVVSPDVDREARFRVPRVLREHGVRSMVNVLIPGGASPYGVLEVDATRITGFGQDEIAFLRNYANLLAAAIGRIETQDRLKTVAGERDLLLGEVQHRVKNLLMVVDTLASQTSTGERTADEFREVFLGRLRAFGRAEQLAFEDESGTLDMRTLLELVLKAYLMPRHERVSLTGPAATLTREQAKALGLIVHELATNAAKYGALSSDRGTVAVHWTIEAGNRRELSLSWVERGGPPVGQPVRKGFGTRLIAQAASMQLKGSAELRYEKQGLVCEIAFLLDGDGKG